MDGSEGFPVTVEGDWSPAQTRILKNKLQLHFGNKRKSNGGECRVEVEAGAPRATVYFTSQDVRTSVLQKEDHEITVEDKTFRLRLTSGSNPTKNNNNVSDSPKDLKKTQKLEGAGKNEAAAANKDDSQFVQSVAAVLENVPDNMNTELLLMLVDNISGLDEDDYNLETIWDSNTAVITFNKPADLEKFLSVSQTNKKLQKQGLSVRPLEPTKSIRLESLPLTVNEAYLELYFDKTWTQPDKINMIPDEKAAIAIFSDAKVVESICKKDHVMCSAPVKVYPYFKSLGTALYGKERPTWKMPEPFTENIHHSVWKFLQMKKELKSINDQMRPHFCCVDLCVDTPKVKLSPQKGLTATQVDTWKNIAQETFQQQMSQYSYFECPANASAWKDADKDVRSVVKEDAFLELDTSRGALTVAARAEDIKRIKSSVENIVLKAVSVIERQKNTISEMMDISPAMFYILKQDGLQKASQDISPELKVSYDENTQKLTTTGLHEELYKFKSWILERNMHMIKKPLDFSLCLLGFLSTVDPMDLSQDLFTSQGIGAFYCIDRNRVILVGSSDTTLTDAENKLKSVLSQQTLDVEDQEVLRLHNWPVLNQQLLDTYNSSKKKTVSIQIHPERRDKITVAGFVNPVKEVSRSLKEFIVSYSRVSETMRVESCAVVQFIDKKKSNDWNDIAKTNDVRVQFHSERQKIIISGARLHVQKAKSCFQKLISSLFTDTFAVDKPGAKKYLMSQGSLFLSSIMNEFSCVVVLRPDNQEEEEEDETYEIVNGFCYCRVQTASGVLLSVTKGDICSFSVDAVVNAANEKLEHIGGLALALLNSAGPQLQKISNDYVAKNGPLRPGEAISTDGYNLPCKHVVHAVGPRFSDSDRRTAVSLLKRAVRESLRQAESLRCSTIALPAISSGVFGFPVDLCAETIAEAVREFCDSPQGPQSLTQIHLVDNNDNTVRALASSVNKEFSDLEPTMTEPPQASWKGAGPSGGNEWGQGRGQNQNPSGRGERGRGGGSQAGRQGNRGNQGPWRHNSPEGAKGARRMEQTTAEGLKIVLCKGNIQDQTTSVIVNTIGNDLNLNQGAVSKALLLQAGSSLQSAVRSAAKGSTTYGDVVITNAFKLSSQKVFHAVCPHWDNGTAQAEEMLIRIIRFCLEEAEKLKMKSLSFPALGTGNLGFPRDLVCRLFLKEINSYSRRKTPRHLKEVDIVVHPSDRETVDSFTREFRGETGQRNIQHEAMNFNEIPVQQSPSAKKSNQTSASFGVVSSPNLGVYQMQMGQLSLEVSSGDITKETSDVIINSSNKDFNLKSGVSKAILDGAGLTVELECDQIVNSPGYQHSLMIRTSAGQLPSKNIIHVVGQNDPERVKEIVDKVLIFCEENKLNSVSFPALGTGQGGAKPSAVADAMVGAVVDFVRKKRPKFVQSVKILIFQTAMIHEFHKSMKSRQGQEVEEKNFLTKFIDTLFRRGEERTIQEDLVLEKEEFEPAVVQLCADDRRAVSQAKKRILDLIVAEQATKTISDTYIRQLSQADMEHLNDLQRELTVSIYLDKGLEDQEPKIHLEGLTRDVFTAESAVRDIIRKVERMENLRSKAMFVSGQVEWQYPQSDGTMVPFDIYTNLNLEEALEKQQNIKIKINNKTYMAYVMMRKAVSEQGHKEVELFRKDQKDDAALPAHWDDMKGDLVKLVPLSSGSQEYKDVVKEFTKTGLTANIISIERVQNETLWKSYQLLKKHLEKKNKHTNNEKILFHGTSSNPIDLINKQGFNRSYAGTRVGAAIGNGSYFAVDPIYSAQGYSTPDTNGHKRMYVTRVLVGDFTQGRSGLVTPPRKNTGNPADLFDSVTNNTVNPTMFVVFNDIQAYPEYLIIFK